jgi:hypothetical protein
VKVIAGKNLPFRPPVLATAVAALVLDRLDAPQLAWGIVGTIYALCWLVWIIWRVNREEVDLDLLLADFNTNQKKAKEN